MKTLFHFLFISLYFLRLIFLFEQKVPGLAPFCSIILPFSLCAPILLLFALAKVAKITTTTTLPLKRELNWLYMWDKVKVGAEFKCTKRDDSLQALAFDFNNGRQSYVTVLATTTTTRRARRELEEKMPSKRIVWVTKSEIELCVIEEALW